MTFYSFVEKIKLQVVVQHCIVKNWKSGIVATWCSVLRVL